MSKDLQDLYRGLKVISKRNHTADIVPITFVFDSKTTHTLYAPFARNKISKNVDCIRAKNCVILFRSSDRALLEIESYEHTISVGVDARIGLATKYKIDGELDESSQKKLIKMLCQSEAFMPSEYDWTRGK